MNYFSLVERIEWSFIHYRFYNNTIESIYTRIYNNTIESIYTRIYIH